MTNSIVTGKPISVVIEGDAKTRSFYALILNPTHKINYMMTEKYKDVGVLMADVERWAKKVGVKSLVWDAKLKK